MRLVIFMAVPLVAALVCGCGDDRPAVDDEPRSPAGDLPVPAPRPPGPAPAPEPTAAAPGPKQPVPEREPPAPAAVVDAGPPAASGARERVSDCAQSPGESDWQIRAGAPAWREDGSEAGKTAEVVRIPCARPTVALGRGCFEDVRAAGIEGGDGRVCFAEQDATELYRDASRRNKPPLDVAIGKPTIKGPYPAGVLEHVVTNDAEPIGWCINKESAIGRDLDERILVSFRVLPRNARFQDVKVRAPKLGKETRECIGRRVESSRFPMMAAEDETLVSVEIEVRSFAPKARELPSR